MKPTQQSINALRETLDFDYWLKKQQGISYVGVNNDGEVELEECDYNDEDIRE